jgi:hypothetical protein
MKYRADALGGSFRIGNPAPERGTLLESLQPAAADARPEPGGQGQASTMLSRCISSSVST